MSIRPYSPRHVALDLGDTLKISLSSQKQWLDTIWLSFWLVGWAYGEYRVINGLLADQGKDTSIIFVLAWLGAWTVGGIFYIYTVIWRLLGTEIILVSNEAITIKRAILGLGIPREYALENIQSLRISNSANYASTSDWSGSQSNDFRSSMIEFSYGAKTIRFFRGIDETEAERIRIQIERKFPQYRMKYT